MLRRTAAHRLTQIGCRPARTRFERALRTPEATQKRILKGLLKKAESTAYGRSLGLSSDWSYSEFQSRVPVVNYDILEPWVERQRNGEAALHSQCLRFQPTSGSTQAVKWIPYSPDFLRELDEAATPWMSSLFESYPGIRQGRHYWSLSWIPTEQRSRIQSTDDRDFFPLWKRILWSLTQAGSPTLAHAPSVDAATFATLAHLCATDDLSFLSVWSPTFALSLLDSLSQYRSALVRTLEQGHWRDAPFDASGLSGKIPHPGKDKTRAHLLRDWDGKLSPEFFLALWPKLALISAWDTASSQSFAHRLWSHFPQARFEGKGLWATEGVVTFPYFGKMPIAVGSHFLEFRDLETQTVHPVWELRSGQQVQPLLTTGSGFFRYALQDHLEVSGKIFDTPTLTFKGRLSGTDLAGEKISPEFAVQCLSEFSIRTGVKALLLIADPSQRRYRFLIEARDPAFTLTPEENERLSHTADEILRQSFHFALARDLHQLGRTEVQSTSNFLQDYERLATGAGMIRGNLKIEPLLKLRNPPEIELP